MKLNMYVIKLENFIYNAVYWFKETAR
jgi:hypothetical protein